MEAESYIGLQHFPLERGARADAAPKLLEEIADKHGLQFFHNDLYTWDLEIVVGYFHVAISPDGDAWGMADFEENGATPIVHTSSAGIEDATTKIYQLLRLDEIDPYELTATHLGLAEHRRTAQLVHRNG